MPKSRLIKAMGTEDVRVIPRGDDAGGLVSTPMRSEVRWDKDNRWIVNTADFPQVSEEWWDYLVSQENFLDVTGLKRIPANAHQRMFLGMSGSEAAPPKVSEPEPEPEPEPAQPDKQEPSDDAAESTEPSVESSEPPAEPSKLKSGRSTGGKGGSKRKSG